MKNVIEFIIISGAVCATTIGIVGPSHEVGAVLTSETDDEAVIHGLKMWGWYGVASAMVVGLICFDRHLIEED